MRLLVFAFTPLVGPTTRLVMSARDFVVMAGTSSLMFVAAERWRQAILELAQQQKLDTRGSVLFRTAVLEAEGNSREMMLLRRGLEGALVGELMFVIVGQRVRPGMTLLYNTMAASFISQAVFTAFTMAAPHLKPKKKKTAGENPALEPAVAPPPNYALEVAYSAVSSMPPGAVNKAVVVSLLALLTGEPVLGAVHSAVVSKVSSSFDGRLLVAAFAASATAVAGTSFVMRRSFARSVKMAGLSGAIGVGLTFGLIGVGRIGASVSRLVSH